MKNKIDHKSLLKVLEEAVLQAGDFALNFPTGNKNLVFKKKHQALGTKGYRKEKALVSEVDFKVQKIITDYISGQFSDTSEIGLLTEEYDSDLEKFNTDNLFLPRKYTILIDPIDGTANYCQRFPTTARFWSVSVALAFGKEIIGGVIYYPDLGKLLLKTCKDEGLWLNGKLVILDNPVENFKPSDPIRVSGTIREKNRKKFRNIPHFGSFTVCFLGLLKGGMKNSKKYTPELNSIPTIKAYIGQNIDILDLGCCALAYKEAGGKILNGKHDQIHDIPLNELNSEFNLKKSFVMAAVNT